MPLDFFNDTLSDDGQNNKESVNGIVDGKDPLNQTYLNRAPWNLWSRTEVIRKALDDAMAVAQSDRGLTIMSAPDTEVEFKDNGTGDYYFTISNDLFIAPISGLAGNPPVGSGVNPIFPLYRFDDTTGSGGIFDLVCKNTIKAAEGNNRLFFRAFIGSGGSAVSSLEPATAVPADLEEGPVTIVVEMAASGNTVTEIIAAITGNANVMAFLDSGSTGVIAAGTGPVTSDIPRTQFADGHSPESRGGVDDEGFRVTAAEFVSFFDITGTPNTMSEGDSIVIDFADAKSRRDNTLNDALGNSLRIVSNDTVNTSKDHVIPICKVFGGRLYFTNGAVFDEDQVGLLVPDTGNRKNLPFVTVGSDPGADYATISSAVAAVSTAGGIVYVLPGTIQENILISGVSKDVLILGSGKPTLSPDASSPGTVLTISGAITATVTLENFDFSTDAQLAIDADNSSLVHAGIVIRNCDFESDGLTSANLVDISNMEVLIEDCKFNGDATSDYADSINAIEVNSTTTFQSRQRIEISRCYFSNYTYPFRTFTTSTQTFERIVFADNYIYQCGYSPTGDANPLLYLHTDVRDLRILRNYVSEGAAAANSGTFISTLGSTADVGYTVEIAGNRVLNGVRQTDIGTSARYMIVLGSNGVTPDFTAREIHHNHIVCGEAGAYRSAGPTRLTDNIFEDCEIQALSNQNIVRLTLNNSNLHSVVARNAFRVGPGVTAGTTLFEVVGIDFKKNIFSENIVDLRSVSSIGTLTLLEVWAGDWSIAGNILDNSNSPGSGCYGIVIDGGFATVVGNHINSVDYGITVSSNGACVLSANRLESIGTGAGAYGINVSTDDNVINGNNVEGGEYGLVVSGDDNAIAGNLFRSYGTGAWNDTGANNGMRNEADSAYIMTHNWK